MNTTAYGLESALASREQPEDAQAGLNSLSNTERFRLTNPTGSAYDGNGKLLNNVSAAPGSAASLAMMNDQLEVQQKIADASNQSRAERASAVSGGSPVAGGGFGLGSATGYNSDRQNSFIERSKELTTMLRDGSAKFSGGPQDQVTRSGSSFRGAMGLADGGSVDEAARMRAEMAKKYGLSTVDAEAPVPKPAPVATAQKKPDSGIVSGFLSLIGRRNKAIDDAAGYRKGGLVDVQDMRGGGKLTGPGTATSDSIPIVAPHAGYMLPAKTVEALGGAEAIRGVLERLTAKEGPGNNQAEEAGEGVPVMGSNGEVMLTPEEVAALGGKEVLDALVRATNGKEPGGVPVRDGEHPMAKRMAVGGFVDDERPRPTSFGLESAGQALLEKQRQEREARGDALGAVGHEAKRIIGLVPPDAKYAGLQTVDKPAASVPAPKPSAAATPRQSAGLATVDAPRAPVSAAADLQARSNASEAVRTAAQRAAGINTGSGDAMSNARYGLNSIANNDGVRDAFNAAHSVQGDGISYGITTGADGKKQTLISGGVATKPQYVDRQGNATNDYYRTSQFAQGLETADRMAKLAANMEVERKAGDRESLVNSMAASGDRNQIDGARVIAGASIRDPQQARLAQNAAEVQTETAAQALGRQKQINDMLAQLAAEPDQNKRSALLESVLAAQGKDMKDSQYLKLRKKTFNEAGVPVEEHEVPFDTRTGREVVSNLTQNTAAEKVKSDLAAGKISRSEAISKLKTMGFA